MANKIMLQVKDKDSDVTRIECDDFTYNVDTRDLNLYDIIEGDRKKLIAGFQSVVYWKVVNTEKKE